MKVPLSLACAATLLCVSVAATAQNLGPDVSALATQLTQAKETIADWEAKALWGRWLALAVVVLGGTVTALQPFGSRRWCAVGVAVIGVAISALTFLRNDSDADYKTYRKSAQVAMLAVEEAEGLLDRLKKETMTENRDSLAVEIADKLGQVRALKTKITMDMASGDSGLFPTAHAQSRPRPAWISQPRSQDSSAFRYVGTGTDRSLPAAQTQSLEDAQRNAAQDLRIPLDSARRYARPVATFTEYDAGRGAYRHYTLVEVNRALVRR